jgi:hypothetical protein
MDEGEVIIGWCWGQFGLPALALAISASSIWLGVRIINRRERWAVSVLAGAIVVVFAVYPLSIGPASRLSHDPDCPDWIQHELPTFYGPVLRLFGAMPDPLYDMAWGYIWLWNGSGGT